MHPASINALVTNRIAKRLNDLTAQKLVIRAATPDRRTGRCLFDFDSVNATQPKGALMVGAVLCDGKPTDQYYVVPQHVCPRKLLVRPGSSASKWHPYYCDTLAKLVRLVDDTLRYRVARSMIDRLS
mgnify:CR=1 FL=1